MNKEQMKIPFYPDAQQQEIMQIALGGDNAVIASDGTDRFETWEHLVTAGFASKIYSESACKTYQFSVNRKGVEFLGAQG